MSEILRKPEVLAPAGDMERLKAALLYGADAVYLAAQQFGMRTAPSNFSLEELKEGVALAHAQGARVYLTCNTTPRNHEVSQLADFLRQVAAAGVDALIVADPGVLMTAKQVIPQMELHASTQVGVTNYLSAQSLYQMGVKRVVLARELSLEEIAEIRANTPADLELEAFVHGAMCMSVSGRCLLSQYMAGRDANRGACAQPCRWSYRMEEERRPGEYYTIAQDEYGSYILNANDMCLIEHLDKLWKAGITSFKIEGRAKSAYYTAVVTNAYRCAVDVMLADPDHYVLPDHLREEVLKVSHRHYDTGFYFGMPHQHVWDNSYVREWDVVAVVQGWQDGKLLLSQRNRFWKGDELEALVPRQGCVKLPVTDLWDENGEQTDCANRAVMDCSIPYDKALPVGTMLRRKVDEK